MWMEGWQGGKWFKGSPESVHGFSGQHRWVYTISFSGVILFLEKQTKNKQYAARECL